VHEKQYLCLIDPDPDSRTVLSQHLSGKQIAAPQFKSAEEFLTAQFDDQLGCIICETILPGMSGLEFQRELIRQEIDTPIIFATSQPLLTESVVAIKAGAVDYLAKPVYPSSLKSSVTEALSRSHEQSIKLRSTQAIETKFASLSQREHDVLALLVSGSANYCVWPQIIKHKKILGFKTLHYASLILCTDTQMAVSFSMLENSGLYQH